MVNIRGAIRSTSKLLFQNVVGAGIGVIAVLGPGGTKNAASVVNTLITAKRKPEKIEEDFDSLITLLQETVTDVTLKSASTVEQHFATLIEQYQNAVDLNNAADEISTTGTTKRQVIITSDDDEPASSEATHGKASNQDRPTPLPSAQQDMDAARTFITIVKETVHLLKDTQDSQPFAALKDTQPNTIEERTAYMQSAWAALTVELKKWRETAGSKADEFSKVMEKTDKLNLLKSLKTLFEDEEFRTRYRSNNLTENDKTHIDTQLEKFPDLRDWLTSTFKIVSDENTEAAITKSRNDIISLVDTVMEQSDAIISMRTDEAEISLAEDTFSPGAILDRTLQRIKQLKNNIGDESFEKHKTELFDEIRSHFSKDDFCKKFEGTDAYKRLNPAKELITETPKNPLMKLARFAAGFTAGGLAAGAAFDKAFPPACDKPHEQELSNPGLA